MLTAAVLLFGACSSSDDDNNDNGGGSVTIPDSSEKTQDLYADEAQGSVKFTATADWTATVVEKSAAKAIAPSDPDWITLSQYSGSAGTYTLTITLALNTTGNARAASITIRSGSQTVEINVTQSGTKEDGTVPVRKYVKSITEKYVSTDYPDESYTGEYGFSYDGVGRVTEIRFVENGYETETGSVKFTYGSSTVTMEFISYWDTDNIPYAAGQSQAAVKSLQNHPPKGRLFRGINPATRADLEISYNYYKVTATVNLNSDGYIISGKAVEYEVEEGESSTWQSEWIASYDKDNIKSVSYRWIDPDDDDNYSFFYSCTWSNGNLTGVKLDDYLSTTAQYNSDYVNSEIMNIDFNWFAYNDETYHFLDEYQFFNILGLYGNRSVNLVTSTTETSGGSNSTCTYSYKFNGDGCVIELTQNSGYGSTTTFTVSYQ